MDRIRLVLLAVLCLTAAQAHAGLEKFALPRFAEEAETFAPSVAVGPHGTTMIAYNSRGVLLQTFIEVQQIMTRAPGWPVALPDPVALGTGNAPRICWSRDGWVCAFSSAGVLTVVESDTLGNWDTAGAETILIGGAIVRIDLVGIDWEAAGPSVFAVVQTWQDPPFGGFATWYLDRSDSGWSAPQLVVPEQPYVQNPQISWTYGPAGPYPQVFYLELEPGAAHLMSTTLQFGSGWTAPVEIYGDGDSAPTQFSSFFDVFTHAGHGRSILGLGPQATCPCRPMLHQENFMGWQDTEDVTAPVDAYDAAFSPSLSGDDLGKTYAFWVQEGSGPMLEPHSRTLHYRIREMGEWQNRDTLFLDQNLPALGLVVDVDVSAIGEPVMAWTRRDTVGGEPQGERVWIGRIGGPSPVPEPRAAAALSAWPNPFNPRVTLTVEPGAAGPARLEIFDARGRRVRTLLDGTLGAQPRTLDWDGTDAAGRELPSGVYFARCVTPGGTAVEKLLLAR